MRKLYTLLLPVLAIAAFASMSAAAQANTTLYGTCVSAIPHAAEGPCKIEEKFEAFTEARVAVSTKNKAGVKFILKTPKAGITCGKLQDTGFMWNAGGIGHSHEILVFEECVGTGEAEAPCKAPNTINGNGIIEGVVTDEVEAGGLGVKITVESGFGVKCGTTNFGAVTGGASGTQAENTNVLKFSAAGGLKFATEAATITGEDEGETVGTRKPVFIN